MTDSTIIRLLHCLQIWDVQSNVSQKPFNFTIDALETCNNYNIKNNTEQKLIFTLSSLYSMTLKGGNSTKFAFYPIISKKVVFTTADGKTVTEEKPRFMSGNIIAYIENGELKIKS